MDACSFPAIWAGGRHQLPGNAAGARLRLEQIAHVPDEQAGVSQRLRVLRESGFVRVRIEGSRRIYALDSEPLQEVASWIGEFNGFWEQRLHALTGEIARGKAKRRDSDRS